MTNPWLRIPAADYEGHMSSPNVAQQSFLAQTFKESLDKYKSLANDAGLQEMEARTVTLESGKPFFIGTYASV